MSSSLVLASRRTRASLLALLALAACDGQRAANARADANAAANAGGLAADSAAAYTGVRAAPASVVAGLAVGEGNPDQGFLRRFVAQQESLAFALDRLSPQLVSPVAVAQATTVRDRLAIEYQESVGLLRDWFAEWHDADRAPRSDGELKTPDYRARMQAASGTLARRPVSTDSAAVGLRAGARDTAGLAAIVPGASGAGGDGLLADSAEAQGWSQDGREIERPMNSDADLALRELVIANHRRTLQLTEAYWPHLVHAQVRQLAVDAHRQARLELAALERRDNTGAPAPSGQDPRIPSSGVPKAGLDDGTDAANRRTVPQPAQRPDAPAPAPPGATPTRTP